MNKKLAKIRTAKLEIQERGILTFWIHVDYEVDGLSQGVGGVALDDFNSMSEEREGTAYGCEIVRRLLVELEVDDFSEMPGQHIWVLGEGEGFNFKAKGIQSLSTNNSKSRPLIFEDVLNHFKERTR